MGERTSYSPGTFSWAELATSYAEGAKSFYTTLFGWTYDDRPAGEGMIYSMANRDGHSVAALFGSDEPPHWNCYVTVASADDAAARAAELGGKVLAEAFDVMDVGRMAVIADPTGAALCLWEPRSNIGAALVNVPGAMTWNDLVTPDPDAAAVYYGDLFGWTTEEMPGSGGYRVIRNGERGNGGIMPLDRDRMGADTPRAGCRTSGTRTSSGSCGRSTASAAACSTDRCTSRAARSRCSGIPRERCSRS
jgi:predicted enzyme related to lactoylglutathione lyase